MKTIALDYQKNTRDLGGMKTMDGHTIKKGRLFRSGNLHKVSEEDIRVLEGLRLTDIVDFRAEGEFQKHGDYPLTGVKQHNFPALEEDFQLRHIPKELQVNPTDFNLIHEFAKPHFDGMAWMKGLYLDLAMSPKGIAAYRNFFALLQSKDDGVYLWHCSQGKDRAGLASYFLEIALGVDEKTAEEDYLLSKEAMREKIEELRPRVLAITPEEGKEKAVADLCHVFSVDLQYLQAAKEAIDEAYGSIHNYLKNALHADMEKLKTLFLD